MLTLMRRHAKSWFIKVALGIIAIVFIFWGVGSYSAKQANRAALVNGEVISLAQYGETYRNLVENARRTFGDALNDELIKRLNLKDQALERLISKSLTLQAAARAGVQVSDEALQASIMRDPAFQDNGHFSAVRYDRLLAANNLDKLGFEADRRVSMITAAMGARLEMLSQVSEQEILDFFHWQSDQVKISYVEFDPLKYQEGVTVSDQDIAAFFEKNKAAYMEPEKVQVDYLVFEPSKYLDKAQVTPEEVKEIYDLTMDSFMEPERVKIRDVLFPLSEEGGEEEIAKVQGRAEAFFAKAQAGEDFIALAKEAEPGADYDREPEWLTRDKLAPETAEAAFAAEPGKVVGPVRSDLGFHVIKVEAQEKARQRSFEEVKEDILERLREEKAKELALEAAENAYGLSLTIKNMAELGKQIGLTPQSAGPFSRQSPPEGALSDPKFLEVAFSLEEGEVGPAVELEGGYYLLMTTRKLPSHNPDLAKVKVKVEADLVIEKAKETAQAEARELLKKAKTESWLTLIREGGLSLKETAGFTRRGPAEGLGYNAALTEAAFRLSFGKPLPEDVFEVGNKFVVIHFEDHIRADTAELEKIKDNLRQALINQRHQELSTAWLGELRQRADVEIDEQVL